MRKSADYFFKFVLIYRFCHATTRNKIRCVFRHNFWLQSNHRNEISRPFGNLERRRDHQAIAEQFLCIYFNYAALVSAKKSI